MASPQTTWCWPRWPGWTSSAFLASWEDIDRRLPADFEERFGSAWSSTIWRHLVSGSPRGAFSADDPIRVLSHNLDFWIPAVTHVIQQRLRELPEVDNGIEREPVRLIDGSVLEGAVAVNPRMGSDIWTGEEDAASAVADVVAAADGTGRLRSTIEEVRSNRVDDDFSTHWSFAREDFERKLYRKRAKVKVAFVELRDTLPVQGPETNVVEGDRLQQLPRAVGPPRPTDRRAPQQRHDQAHRRRYRAWLCKPQRGLKASRPHPFQG